MNGDKDYTAKNFIIVLSSAGHPGVMIEQHYKEAQQLFNEGRVTRQELESAVEDPLKEEARAWYKNAVKQPSSLYENPGAIAYGIEKNIFTPEELKVLEGMMIEEDTDEFLMVHNVAEPEVKLADRLLTHNPDEVLQYL